MIWKEVLSTMKALVLLLMTGQPLWGLTLQSEPGVCDLRPLGTKTAPLMPDNRFAIEIDGVQDEYIPDQKYTVRLYSRDNSSTFIAFTISAKEDEKENEKNPRRPVRLEVGHIEPLDAHSIPGDNCNNTVVQADVTPKLSVNVTWKAPLKENKCVTIFALVAINQNVWYNFGGPLSKRVCEDRRKAEDMQPLINDDCRVCADALYKVTFEGTWSYNTHPLMFPTAPDSARFSDLVGASHTDGFTLWKSNSEATEGLKMVAEQGNTTKMELEIQDAMASKSIRTVIKANGSPRPNMTTSALFRVTQRNHLVSMVAGILPSPDWFLGVANMELCPVTSNGADIWADSIRLNLYPLDAGTDSGKTFEAPNEATLPSQPISTAIINENISKEQIKPFARVHYQLIRTYTKKDCEVRDMTQRKSVDNSYGGYEESIDPIDAVDQQNPYEDSKEAATLPPDPDSDEDCPMTQWEDWMPCEGICDGATKTGYRMRQRYHMVDGSIVGKYGLEVSGDLRVPYQCEGDRFPTVEMEECSEPCQLDTSTVPPISPGQTW